MIITACLFSRVGVQLIVSGLRQEARPFQGCLLSLLSYHKTALSQMLTISIIRLDTVACFEFFARFHKRSYDVILNPIPFAL